ncbi:probable G-protein coupled receptor Mth-like 1 [Venturia canescens]|uniref:probable G-protein coupled receptor Mth-like 1 n=1 Tax=Venturia canescens TaxID=32260 RepID=UPI001C9BD145|nr:probable G-protein coupled receptor Mth-like 1 [Venturia canescens]
MIRNREMGNKKLSSSSIVCATLFAALVVFSDASEDVAGKTTVLKCCKYGEELSKPTSVYKQNYDNSSELKCLPSSIPWEPFIYSPTKGGLISNVPDTWHIIEGARPHCNKKDEIVTYFPSSELNPVIILETGPAMLQPGSGTFFEPGQYCSDSRALLVCAPRKIEANNAAATMRPKIHRCCGDNAIFHEKRKTCVHLKESEIGGSLLPNASSIVELVSGFPPCPRSDNFTIVGAAEDALVQPDGGLEINGVNLPSEHFCVERINELNGAAKIFACSEYGPQRPDVQPLDIRFTMYPISFIISAIFLAATLAAGWLLPASHHVLHWRCQTHHVVCLMLADILMAVIQLGSDSLHGSGLCDVVAILAHFFFLAAFFWLNTMCFNIWWTFRDLRPASLEKGQETLRLRVYACYAWGGPLLVAGLAALLDHLPPQPHYTFLKPRFGEKQCWFYGDTEILAYFFGPIGVLLFINVVFFIATARELTCGLWKGEFVKSTTERAALGRVCMKLVIVMGVTWIADVVSWVVGGPHYVWYFTDLLNALQGLFIFIVVGWQPQVRAGLKRLFNRNPRTNAGRQGNGLSTTSHGMPSMGDSVTQNPSTKTAPLETIC